MPDQPHQPDLTATHHVPPSASRPGAGEGRFPAGSLIAQRYRVIGLLGRGGMGEVYRADDLLLGQPVALKFLPDRWLSDQSLLDRFRDEVRIARMVTHPNVCRVHDLGEADGCLFLSMEFIDGEDLSSLLRRIGRLPEDKGLEIARKLSAGLHAAHAKGIVHRDLKPANIMIDGRGEVVITDFGLAAFAGSVRDLSSGTPAYMAPEQREGREVTPRSDIYAMGIVLFEVFTGRRPEDPTTPTATLDPAISRVLDWCREADPAHRPVSALDVARALPGGDPLAAALASGQTPSPEAVAASGERTGLRPALALPLALLPLLGLFVVGWVSDGVLGASRILSPDEMRIRARELVRKLEPAATANEQCGVFFDSRTATAVNQRPARDREPLWSAQRFWCRASPLPLGAFRLSGAALAPYDPPLATPGMSLAVFDMNGKLTGYERVPREPESPAASGPDWDALLSAAGLERARLQQTGSTADTAAWDYSDPAGLRYRVRAAAQAGRVHRFEVRGEWQDPSPGSPGPWIFETVLLLAAGLFAVRNYRLGRVDVRGTASIALLVLVTSLAALALRVQDPLHWNSAVTPFDALSPALAAAAIGAGMYLAVEPFVRRRWPQVLVTWTRLLHGGWRDATVGRDVLVGMAASGLTLGIGTLMFRDAGIRAENSSLAFLQGPPFFVAGIFHSIGIALFRALIMLFVMFLLRLLLRRDWAVAVVTVALFAAMLAAQADLSGPALLATALLIGSVQVAILMRFGFLAKTAAEVTVLGATLLVRSFDTSSWLSSYSWAAVAWVAFLAVVAFRIATAGHSLFPDDAV
jgi:serine/threonine protein kinase